MTDIDLSRTAAWGAVAISLTMNSSFREAALALPPLVSFV